MRHQKELIREAILAKVNSYAPYSKFRVGASALMKDGTIIRGCNVENASYGLSMCAERVCLYNVYSNGFSKDDIVGFAISADTNDFISPCGACRQVMVELLNETCSVFLLNKNDDFKEVKVKRLLPFSFSGDVIDE